MEWPVVTLIGTLAVTFLTFLWGIAKTFKKSNTTSNWVAPLEEHKKLVERESKQCQLGIQKEIKELNSKLIQHEKEIHDLKKDRDIVTDAINEVKGEVNKVSSKCDTILEKVIKYLSRD